MDKPWNYLQTNVRPDLLGVYYRYMARTRLFRASLNRIRGHRTFTYLDFIEHSARLSKLVTNIDENSTIFSSIFNVFSRYQSTF